MSDTQKTVRESSDKIRVATKVKRGSGTRDQDEIKIKVRGDDPDDVVARLNKTIANLETTADDVRNLRAGENDE